MGANELTPVASSPRKSKLIILLLTLLAVIAVAVVGGRIWYRYTFPYGWSHACSKGLGLGLRMYSGENDHWLPHGAATPEASLSLLYRNDPDTALWVLGGKNIPRERVQATFARDGILSPATCGWHYVEGLRDDDDPQIAVVWDKVFGLGHNGERKRGMMHEVVLLDGANQYVSKDQWPKFIADQKERLEKVIADRSTNAPRIRWSDTESLGPNLPAQK
jgi:hypothetical protein